MEKKEARPQVWCVCVGGFPDEAAEQGRKDRHATWGQDDDELAVAFARLTAMRGR